MTRLLVTGDWHLCMRNFSSCETVVDQTVRLLKRHAPCHFLHLGDIVGDRGPSNPQDVRCTNALIEFVAEIKKVSESFVFIRGNHDMIAGPDGVPSCCPLLRQCGVDHIADDGFLCHRLLEETSSDVADTLRARIWAVPYFRDPIRQRKEFADALRLRKSRGLPKSVDILAFHNEIKGCERNAASKGEGLTLDDIGAAEYDLCLGGHIHRPQFMIPNVHFVGSPMSSDWGDVNTCKRFLLIEI